MEEKGNPPPYGDSQLDFDSQPQSNPNFSKEDFSSPHSEPPQVQTVVVTPRTYGPTPEEMICPSCHANIKTTVKNEPTTTTHLWALLGCCLGGLMCVWIPYCVDSCQSQQHYCPNCQAYLGRHEN